MSELIYDAAAGWITLVDRTGHAAGAWPAANVVEQRLNHLRFVPNGTHILIDQATPHRHAGNDGRGVPLDSVNGAYGSYRIVRLAPIYGHTGIGVHSGRAQRPDGRGRTGPSYAT
jgi:hypothetical protein